MGPLVDGQGGLKLVLFAISVVTNDEGCCENRKVLEYFHNNNFVSFFLLDHLTECMVCNLCVLRDQICATLLP